MGVYNLNITGKNKPEYLLSEHHIYGSSRLGIQNYEGYDKPDNYHRLVGDKNFELANHLGNVLSVVTDRKITPKDLEVAFSDSFTINQFFKFLELITISKIILIYYV